MLVRNDNCLDPWSQSYDIEVLFRKPLFYSEKFTTFTSFNMSLHMIAKTGKSCRPL